MKVRTKQDELRSWMKWAVMVLGPISALWIYVGVLQGDVRLVIPPAVFDLIMVGVFLFARSRGSIVAVPDRPLMVGKTWTNARPVVQSCEKCERMVSSKAKVCPFCGAKIRQFPTIRP